MLLDGRRTQIIRNTYQAGRLAIQTRYKHLRPHNGLGLECIREPAKEEKSDKPMLKRKVFFMYKRLLTSRKPLLATVCVLSVVSVAVESIGLVLIYPLLDSMIGVENDQGRVWQLMRDVAGLMPGTSTIEGLLYLFVGLFFIKAIVLTLTTAFREILVGRLRQDWSAAALHRYLYGPYAHILSEPRGKIIQNISNEPLRAASAVALIITVLTRALMIIALVATLLLLNWQATMVIMALVLILALAIKYALLRPMHRWGRKKLAANQAITTLTTEAIVAANVVKLLGIQSGFLTRLVQQVKKFIRAKTLISAVADIPVNFGEFLVVVVVTAAFLIAANVYGVTFQEAAPLIGSYAIISFKLSTLVSRLLGQWLKIGAYEPTIKLIHDLAVKELPQRISTEGIELEKITSDIEFRGVDFSYVHGTKVLNDLTLIIPNGKIVGIVGPSGAGKTTLGYLLTRLYERDNGSILINGRDIRDYSVASLRRRIGYVEQDPIMFSGTLEENIRLGASEIGHEKVLEAAKAAGAHDFINALAQGYQTMLGDSGLTLSGGERQRIAIARAIARKPDLFIIDEGTSALDKMAEAKIRKLIAMLARKTTVIVIAHRISTLESADVIYEMQHGGKVIERTLEEVSA